jgi:hypothetical protein
MIIEHINEYLVKLEYMLMVDCGKSVVRIRQLTKLEFGVIVYIMNGCAVEIIDKLEFKFFFLYFFFHK